MVLRSLWLNMIFQLRMGSGGLAIVGEAPGKEEVRMGHPFVGSSGRLLDEMLGRAAIARRDCLVANVFRFQPPGNNVGHFFAGKRAATVDDIRLVENLGKFGSVFCREEFTGEIEALAATLRRLQPRVILALGRTPLWALTGENGLLEKAGRVLPCRLARRIPVIPTYHPSYILRGNWRLSDQWLEHFVAARDLALASK